MTAQIPPLWTMPFQTFRALLNQTLINMQWSNILEAFQTVGLCYFGGIFRKPFKYYFADFVCKWGTLPPLRNFFLAKKELRIWGVPPTPVYGFPPEN